MISIKGKSITDYTSFLIDILSGRRQGGELHASNIRWNDINEFMINRGFPLRVLDLGNGRLRPQFEILRRQGHVVDGIDFVNKAFTLTLEDIGYVFARFIFNLSIPGTPNRNSRLHVGNVENLPFASNTYDFVTSIAAFEHFLNVPQVLSEVHRVLKPGGLFWCSFHLFTSLSGGHNVGFILGPVNTLPVGVEPWDHLRKGKLPITVPLNKLRLHEYMALFKNQFEIVKHYSGGTEGVELLRSLGPIAELQNYSEDELTTACYTIVARKVE